MKYPLFTMQTPGIEPGTDDSGNIHLPTTPLKHQLLVFKFLNIRYYKSKNLLVQKKMGQSCIGYICYVGVME